MTRNTTVPFKTINGGRLEPDTVAGRKNELIFNTNTGAVSFSVAANNSFHVSYSTGLWPDSIPASSRDQTNIIPASDCIVWPQLDVWVDVKDTAHYIGNSSLTAAQLKVTAGIFRMKSPLEYLGGELYSSSFLIEIVNQDSSSHTIYIEAQNKYLIYGQQSI